ncbi:MAG TPA: GNAT family N-acetyltransferase [Myxococcales bacterium]|nr:GNAT family N-acetyltransferase [Myxococcales bacterium]
MRIRPASIEDAALLAPLCEQLGYPTTAEQIVARLRSILRSRTQAVFVAEAGGRIAGWIHVHESLTVESGPDAEIGGLVVDETARRQGIGRALVAEARRWARESGYDSIVVRSNVVRREAHPFYEGLGFRRAKTAHVYVRDP